MRTITPRWASALALLALLMLVAPAGAQNSTTTSSGDVYVLPGDVLVTGTEVWNESRDVPGLLFIRGNASLTIVGARVTLGQLGVEPGGRLALVSEPGASAVLAAHNQSWKGVVAGTFDAQGLPDAPAIVDGVGGTAKRQENNVLFQGGFYMSGNGTVKDFTFTNYTSGMYVSHGGSLTADSVRFDSKRGMGLIVSDGSATVSHAQFDGAAGVYSTRLGKIDVEDASFDSPPTAVITSAIEARLKDIRVAHAQYCVEVHGGSMTLDGLECHDFRRAGIRAILTPPSQEAFVDIANADVSTTNASNGEGHGIYLDSLTAANITSTTLGPLPGNGLIEIGVAAKTTDLTIRGAAFYGEVMVDPPADTTMVPHYTGAPGRNGWFETKWTVAPKVLRSNGEVARNATVAYYLPGNATPLHAHTVNGPEPPQKGPTLLSVMLLPNATEALQFRYVARAKSEDLKEEATVTFVPDGKELVIQLLPAAPASTNATGATDPASVSESRPAPGPGLPLLVAAVALAFVWNLRRKPNA